MSVDAKAIIITAQQMISLYQQMIDQDQDTKLTSLQVRSIRATVKALQKTCDEQYLAVENATGKVLLGRKGGRGLVSAITLLHWCDWVTVDRQKHVQIFGLPAPSMSVFPAECSLLDQSLLDAVRRRFAALKVNRALETTGDGLSENNLGLDAVTLYATLYMCRLEEERALCARLRAPVLTKFTVDN